MTASELAKDVLEKAIQEAKKLQVPVFTFALYHDHESRAISVCIDTEECSNKTVQSMNGYNMKYFMKAIAGGDLQQAKLWRANIGRSLSLGDFALVNVARTSLGTVKVDDRFYLELVQTLVAMQTNIAALAPHRDRLLFACSGAEDEVAYTWSLPVNE